VPAQLAAKGRITHGDQALVFQEAVHSLAIKAGLEKSLDFLGDGQKFSLAGVTI
jgi:hypothetical protein